MISVPTVLVLGAGASCDLNYPTGRGLVDRVCLTARKARNGEFSFYRESPSRLDAFELFASHLRKSGLASVDTFVERHLDGQNAEILETAKDLVALSLIPFESTAKMFGGDASSERPAGRWYEYLLNALATPRAVEFNKNRLSIVTFNYDRSFEQYLLIALQNAYGVPREVAVMLARTIDIAHVYGDLGELYDSEADDFREYQDSVSPRDLQVVRKRLRLIVEERVRVEDETTPQGSRARAMLAQAERIYFVGFAYDPLNLRRIQPRTFIKNLQVNLSSYGMSPKEFATAQTNVDKWLGGFAASTSRDFGNPLHQCLEFMRHTRQISS